MAEDTRDALSLTDDEENDGLDDDEYQHLPCVKGLLSKWTNYIHGWQDRYIVLKDGTLSYYKSEDETAFGCRGAVSLNKVIITPHEFDDCRFDVSVNDCLWYLRTKDASERQTWVDALELHKTESGYSSENNLRRHGSMISLTSGTSLSTASTSSFKRGHGLKEKLAEMETFRDILCRQVDSLQSYFDACSSAVSQSTVHDLEAESDEDEELIGPNNMTNGFQSKTNTFTQYDGPKGKDIVSILQQHGAHAIDFKGESFTFKATTAGILATMSHCIELMSQREESWRKKVEREMEKRKKLEENYRQLLQQRPKQVIVGSGGPDFEEGPHSCINEDEFFDAIDASLDKLEKEEEQRLQNIRKDIVPKPSTTSLNKDHPLYNEVQSKIQEHLERHMPSSPEAVEQDWQLFFEEGDLRVFKRDSEEDGMIIYPVKVTTKVKNVTGYEMCKYFWDPEFRLEWDSMIENCTIVDWLSKHTVVTYQTYKRVWPSAQRDNLFWSAIQQVSDRPIRGRDSSEDTGEDVWMVVNFTTTHPDAVVKLYGERLDKVVVPKCVRIRINVSMMCYTIIEPPKPGQEITRDNITAKLHYYAHVNPGGWAPQSVIKMISRREVSKFVKQFSKYVQDKTVGQPIQF